MIEKAKDQNIKTCIFGGDWHHQRASVNVSTLNYTLKGLQKLNDNFDNVYMIPGNHDEYYKDIVVETIDFLNSKMSSKEGLYYAAMDADTDGEEGK